MNIEINAMLQATYSTSTTEPKMFICKTHRCWKDERFCPGFWQ